MIYSMTGFATRSIALGTQTIHLELRSVNSRFLDIHLRLVDELRGLEPLIREKLTAKLHRGKVECRLQLQKTGEVTPQLTLNEGLLTQLLATQNQILARMPQSVPLSVGEIVRWPGILGDDSPSFELLQTNVATLLEVTLEELIATRRREGEKLAQIILKHCQAMRNIVAEVTPHIPAAVAEYQSKLTQRLQEAVSTLDEDRIRLEVGLFAQRIDVAEELNRLSTHLDELERILQKGGATGKRLDFLMQELNREANTLGSKAANPTVTNASLSLKLLIEQIREQVQNLE